MAHETKFMEVCVAAPGASSDSHAVRESRIVQKLESLPPGIFVVADNAYDPSEHLHVPFAGIEKSIPQNDAFHFHLSQLRIKVEQAFGKLTNKFQILNRPLTILYENICPLFFAITRMHNNCIEMNTAMDKDKPEVMVTITRPGYNRKRNRS